MYLFIYWLYQVIPWPKIREPIRRQGTFKWPLLDNVFRKKDSFQYNIFIFLNLIARTEIIIEN